MIIFTGAPMMMMCPTGNLSDALVVVATTDAPDGALPPGNTGDARDDVTIEENDMSDSSGIFPAVHACLFGGLLA